MRLIMRREKQVSKSSGSEESIMNQHPDQSKTSASNDVSDNDGSASPDSVGTDGSAAMINSETTDVPSRAEVSDATMTDESEASPIDALQKKYNELHERLLRVSADYQNYVRRSVQNIATAKDQQLIDIAKGLITVLDHLDRALEADPQKTTSESLLEGVQIVREELLKALEQFGVKRLNVDMGEPFDPTCHEALMRQGAEGIESNHVVSQIQPGYMLNEKTLRAAKVTVST